MQKNLFFSDDFGLRNPVTPKKISKTCYLYRSMRLPSIIRTGFGRKEFGAGIEAFWRRIIDDPNAFPPEFWQLFLQANLTALGENCCLVCVGMAWRRLIAAETMRQ